MGDEKIGDPDLYIHKFSPVSLSKEIILPSLKVIYTAFPDMAGEVSAGGSTIFSHNIGPEWILMATILLSDWSPVKKYTTPSETEGEDFTNPLLV